MLVLLFHIGAKRWALATSQVKDVLPLVSLQTFSYGLDSCAGGGLLNYHGEMVPTVDVSGLVTGTAAPQSLGTRIALVEAEVALGAGLRPARLGLILDCASETAQLSEALERPVQIPFAKALLRSQRLSGSKSIGSEAVIPLLAIAPLFEQANQPSHAPANPSHQPSHSNGYSNGHSNSPSNGHSNTRLWGMN